MKVLNLYCGIGGNRKLWPKECQVTAIENNQEIAKTYQTFFPNDKIIVTDAHKYLLEHHKEFDFIWSSPPCPTHSRTNTFLHAQGIIRYPDMRLWQEILFLNKWFKGKFVVENVITYYPPLIKPVKIHRHYFWANFFIDGKKFNHGFNILNSRETTRCPTKDYLKKLEKWHGFILQGNIKGKLTLLRNCVYPPLGKFLFECAFKGKQTNLKEANK